MNQKKDQLLLCPCCGEFTLSEKDFYEICPICQWEDDPIQSSDSTYVGGANTMSLNQAREDWLNKKSKAP
ncbi:MAG: CPCC family cysteine-rich protein [Noviherbaspirillum sp.]